MISKYLFRCVVIILVLVNSVVVNGAKLPNEDESRVGHDHVRRDSLEKEFEFYNFNNYLTFGK